MEGKREQDGGRSGPDENLVLLRKWCRYEPMSQDEIAKCMGVTRQRIWAAEQSALAKIKKCIEDQERARGCRIAV